MLRNIELTDVHTSAAGLLEQYWDWQIEQENHARQDASVPIISPGDWEALRTLVVDTAWKLAIEGYIQEIPAAGVASQVTASLREKVASLGLKRFDFISVQDNGKIRFRHQKYQAVSAARAISDSLHDSDEPCPSMLDELLRRLAADYPDPERLRNPSIQQFSFWVETFELAPGVLRVLYGARLTAWNQAFWRLMLALIEQGLVLFAWNTLLRAQREFPDLSVEEEWEGILWQLVRYRRDVEGYFPDSAKKWHYDPLRRAVAMMDGLNGDGRDRLRRGLTRLFKADGLSYTVRFGAYELVAAYLDWIGDDGALDACRIGFLLGTSEGCNRLLDARHDYENGGEIRVSRDIDRQRVALEQASGSDMPPPDDAVFGRWLQSHYHTEAGEAVGASLAEFESNDYLTEYNPKSEAFSNWIGKVFVEAVVAGERVPMDVSMRIFGDYWNWSVGNQFSRLPNPEATALALLKDENQERRMCGAIVLGGIVDRLRESPEWRDEILDLVTRRFDQAVGNQDIEWAYTWYHECGRFENQSKRVLRLQEYVKRYWAQEIRWHDPYISDDQIGFMRKRLGRESPYPDKRWAYCYAIPLVLERGGQNGPAELEKVLADYETIAEKPHEQVALKWARNAIACVSQL